MDNKQLALLLLLVVLLVSGVILVLLHKKKTDTQAAVQQVQAQAGANTIQEAAAIAAATKTPTQAIGPNGKVITVNSELINGKINAIYTANDPNPNAGAGGMRAHATGYLLE